MYVQKYRNEKAEDHLPDPNISQGLGKTATLYLQKGDTQAAFMQTLGKALSPLAFHLTSDGDPSGCISWRTHPSSQSAVTMEENLTGYRLDLRCLG